MRVDVTHPWCYTGIIQIVLAVLVAVSLLLAWPEPLLAQHVPETRVASTLDFETFESRVLPILTRARKGHARCVACHSRGGGNSFLEPLSPGVDVYTREQALRNFDRIQRLVVAGEPLKSPLLLNPLAEDAGGSHWHGGGKHWDSQTDHEWQTLAAWVRTNAPTERSTLSYERFKDRVQPILTARRSGHARCVACHARGGGNSFLEPLSPGSSSYSEEQSRRNFERVARLVVPGQPEKSLLLVNPLAEQAGGSHWHGGGKHWTTQDDPEFQVLSSWVTGSSR